MRHSGKSKYDNTGNVSVSVTHSHVRIKSFFVGKQWVLHILCVRVYFIIQHAMLMRRFMLSSVAYLSLPYFFSHYAIRHDFWKKKACEHKTWVWIFSINLSKIFLILRRIQRDIFINVHKSSWNCMLSYLDFSDNWTFSTYFEKYSNIQFNKNPSIGNWGVPGGRTEIETVTQTDVTKPVAALRNFTNSPKKDKN